MSKPHAIELRVCSECLEPWNSHPPVGATKADCIRILRNKGRGATGSPGVMGAMGTSGAKGERGPKGDKGDPGYAIRPEIPNQPWIPTVFPGQITSHNTSDEKDRYLGD